jgi:predicted nucleotidyltransferase
MGIFTRKALHGQINSFLYALKNEAGYPISKAVLFGSYAKGGVKPESDIDLAIWSPKFEGSLLLDLPPIVGLVSRFHPISIRPFPENASPEDFPFIEEILKTGVEIALPEDGKTNPNPGYLP